MHNTAPSPYIGSSEVCEILGIDRSTLNRWIRSGRITPVTKLSGHTGAYVFDRATVLQHQAAS